jgi:hypothetical protein
MDIVKDLRTTVKGLRIETRELQATIKAYQTRGHLCAYKVLETLENIENPEEVKKMLQDILNDLDFYPTGMKKSNDLPVHEKEQAKWSEFGRHRGFWD